MLETIVSMTNISKKFSGVNVLNNVSFHVYKGKIMALLGENGAGKSTLMKILTGVYEKTEGEILLFGESVAFSGTKESQSRGIAIIHQELNLIDDLSIGENIFLGREPLNAIKKINWKDLYEQSEKWMKKLGLQEDPRQLVKNISVGKQQLVEIAKAISMDARVIIMDEPTGALTMAETEKLFQVIAELKAEGRSIVYISHRLNEIFEICDDLTILRDGELVAERSVSELNEDEVIEMMVGRRLEEQYPRIPCRSGAVCLEVSHLTNDFISDITFSLKEGEVLGVAGLMGSGRTELARTLYGIYDYQSGQIYMNGCKLRIKNPKDALSHGIAYVSEDRKANGIFVSMNVKENTTLAALQHFSNCFGMIQGKKEEESAHHYIEGMSIKTSGTKQKMKYLSGGNQQKVSIAKNLNTNPKVLILDEPTRGVDVGAKKEIYELMNQYKRKGMSILMISSEISEILGMSDRVMVMHEGQLTGILDRKDASQESIMSLAVGKVVNQT